MIGTNAPEARGRGPEIREALAAATGPRGQGPAEEVLSDDA